MMNGEKPDRKKRSSIKHVISMLVDLRPFNLELWVIKKYCQLRWIFRKYQRGPKVPPSIHSCPSGVPLEKGKKGDKIVGLEEPECKP